MQTYYSRFHIGLLRLCITLFFKDFIYLFLDRGEGREKERERNVSVWSPLERTPPRIWPATQACALPRNRTSDPLVCRPALNPLSYTSQGCILLLTLWQSWCFSWQQLKDSLSVRSAATGFTWPQTMFSIKIKRTNKKEKTKRMWHKPRRLLHGIGKNT